MPIDDPGDDSTHHTWRPAQGPFARFIAWTLLCIIALLLAVMLATWISRFF